MLVEIGNNTHLWAFTRYNLATSRQQSVSCKFWVDLDARLYDVNGCTVVDKEWMQLVVAGMGKVNMFLRVIAA
jgi:hypothetical protein